MLTKEQCQPWSPEGVLQYERPSASTQPHDPKLEPAQHALLEVLKDMSLPMHQVFASPPSSAISVCQSSCSRPPFDATTGTGVLQHALLQSTVSSAPRSANILRWTCFAVGAGFAVGIRRQLRCSGVRLNVLQPCPNSRAPAPHPARARPVF